MNCFFGCLKQADTACHVVMANQLELDPVVLDPFCANHKIMILVVVTLVILKDLVAFRMLHDLGHSAYRWQSLAELRDDRRFRAVEPV